MSKELLRYYYTVVTLSPYGGSMSGYNGWTNYETWRINLEVLDGFDAYDFLTPYDFQSGNEDEQDEMVGTAARELAAYLDEYVTELLTVEGDSPFAQNLVNEFLQKVDWDDLAFTYVRDHIAYHVNRGVTPQDN